MSRALRRGLGAVNRIGGARWRSRPDLEEDRWEVLTAEERAHAAAAAERFGALGLSGIPDADLGFLICLHERLAGERDAPCPPDGDPP